MKRLIALLFLTVATNAHAVNWQLVTDSSDGTRLVSDVDSVRIDKYTKPDKTTGARIYSTMDFISNNEELVFSAVIDAQDCVDHGAGPIVNVYKDGTSNTFFWSKDGGKMYDGQGQWLCGFLKATINQYQKEKTQPKASKPEAKNNPENVKIFIKEE